MSGCEACAHDLHDPETCEETTPMPSEPDALEQMIGPLMEAVKELDGCCRYLSPCLHERTGWHEKRWADTEAAARALAEKVLAARAIVAVALEAVRNGDCGYFDAEARAENPALDAALKSEIADGRETERR